MTDHSLKRSDLDAMPGPIMVEFGANWCSYCQAAQPIIASALAQYPDTAHLKIEDGKGQRLGRSYAVKLWPTLIFLRDGSEIIRIVRPTNADQIKDALSKIQTSPTREIQPLN